MSIKTIAELNEERQQLLAKQISLSEKIKEISSELGIKPSIKEAQALSDSLTSEIEVLQGSLSAKLQEYEQLVQEYEEVTTKSNPDANATEDNSAEDPDFD